METRETEFAESAFRHGYGREDYFESRRNPKMLFGSRRGEPDVYEMLGRNDAGDYLHVVFRSVREGILKRIVVFHIAAMNRADRKRYKRMVGR
jgi:hypothetical protein